MLKLFWTKALPLHYVAKDEAGVRWMIPVTPIAPSDSNRWVRYFGNYTLTRCPNYIERFYQPKKAVA